MCRLRSLFRTVYRAGRGRATTLETAGIALPSGWSSWIWTAPVWLRQLSCVKRQWPNRD